MATSSGLCSACQQPFESELRARLTKALGAVEVNSGFDIERLATVYAARYPDDTYSALRVQYRTDRQEAGLDWLVQAFAKAPRHPLVQGESLIYEEY